MLQSNATNNEAKPASHAEVFFLLTILMTLDNLLFSDLTLLNESLEGVKYEIVRSEDDSKQSTGHHACHVPSFEALENGKCELTGDDSKRWCRGSTSTIVRDSPIVRLSMLSIWQLCGGLYQSGFCSPNKGLGLAFIYFTSVCQIIILCLILSSCSEISKAQRAVHETTILKLWILINLLLIFVVGSNFKELCERVRYDITILFFLILLAIDTLSALKYFGDESKSYQTIKMKFLILIERIHLALLIAVVFLCLKDKIMNKELKYVVAGPFVMLLYKSLRLWASGWIKQFESARSLAICLILYCLYSLVLTFFSFRPSCFWASLESV